MKVVSNKEMARIETAAYANGFSEKDFMEHAGKGIAAAVEEFICEKELPSIVWILCGKGNNCGDAYVAGYYLLQKGFEVHAILNEALANSSPLCKENAERFFKEGGKISKEVGDKGILLDGIFGTGFKGQVSEPYSSLIETANKSGLPIISIDIPSGLNGTTGEIEGACIQATLTLYLGLPKKGFFLRNGWNAVGQLKKVDFGLTEKFIDQALADLELITMESARALLPAIKRNRHKYQAGSVAGIAGSKTMPGAALLSSTSALRAGSGIVRLFFPEGIEALLVSSPYELIKIPFAYNDSEAVLSHMQKSGSAFVGPGLGMDLDTAEFLAQILPLLETPCVIDADALNLFACGLISLPQKALLTPHLGEMQKLLHVPGKLVLQEELLITCQKYVEEKNVTLILKGAPTFIFHPKEPILVNPTGDPGMATAGSGDVLTGLLAALLSQGLACREAALLGVYLHGLAGELAAKKRKTSYGMIASDIIDSFPDAFAAFQKT